MISIVIPAHNEEKRIEKTLIEYYRFLKKKDKFEIIVVANACKDKTVEIARVFGKDKKEIVVLNFIQGGKGFAISEGFKEALKKKENDLIGFVDADMSTSPKDFYDLALNIKNYDGIIASRYIKGAKVFPKQNLNRIIISRLGNLVINSLFFLGFKDTQCGAKLFKRNAIEKTHKELKLTQWAFDVNLLFIIKKEGFEVKEFPTVWKDSPGSTLKLKDASVKALLSVIRLRIIYSPFARVLRPLKIIEKAIWKVMEK